MLCCLGAGQDGHYNVCSRKHILEGFRQAQLVHAFRAIRGSSFNAYDISTHRFHELCIILAYIAQTDDHNGAAVERGDLAVVDPRGSLLLVAVKVELFLQCKRHGKGLLRHGLAVCASGICQYGLCIEHTGRDILIRTRRFKLEQLQILRRAYHRGIGVAYDYVGLSDLLLACAADA